MATNAQVGGDAPLNPEIDDALVGERRRALINVEVERGPQKGLKSKDADTARIVSKLYRDIRSLCRLPYPCLTTSLPNPPILSPEYRVANDAPLFSVMQDLGPGCAGARNNALVSKLHNDTCSSDLVLALKCPKYDVDPRRCDGGTAFCGTFCCWNVKWVNLVSVFPRSLKEVWIKVRLMGLSAKGGLSRIRPSWKMMIV